MLVSFEAVDLIEELRLRRWARENYVSAESRDAGWHDVVHDEMTRKDLEMGRRPRLTGMHRSAGRAAYSYN